MKLSRRLTNGKDPMSSWMMSALLVFSCSLFLNNLNAQNPWTDHQLEGYVVRSYAINPWNTDQLLIGTKSAAGDGKVYFSNDGGNSWMVTNNNKPLSDSTEDVQAVAFLSNTKYIAGCWKTGLYISSNSGQSFEKVKDFPSNDIRAIKVDSKNPDTVFLATTGSGVIKSEDGMKSWILPEDKDLACWDIELDHTRDNSLYVLPFTGGVAKSKDGGKRFRTFHAKEGEMAYDMKVRFDDQTWAVGGGDSSRFIKYRAFNGAGWKELSDSLTPKTIFSAVEKVEDVLYLGTWDMGVLTFTDGKWDSIPEIDAQTITKIDYANDYIYFFTWGNGVYRMQKIIDPTLTIGQEFDPSRRSGAFWSLETNAAIKEMTMRLSYRTEEDILVLDGTSLRNMGKQVGQLFRSQEFADGPYLYIFDVKFENGREKRFEGTVEYKKPVKK